VLNVFRHDDNQRTEVKTGSKDWLPDFTDRGTPRQQQKMRDQSKRSRGVVKPLYRWRTHSNAKSLSSRWGATSSGSWLRNRRRGRTFLRGGLLDSVNPRGGRAYAGRTQTLRFQSHRHQCHRRQSVQGEQSGGAACLEHKGCGEGGMEWKQTSPGRGVEEAHRLAASRGFD
jgi:hypothetical protein